MMQIDTEDENIVTLLHDVLKDHGNTSSMDRLTKEGSSNSVCRDSGQSRTPLWRNKPLMMMFTSFFVRSAAADPIARKVKFAGVADNLGIT